MKIEIGSLLEIQHNKVGTKIKAVERFWGN